MFSVTLVEFSKNHAYTRSRHFRQYIHMETNDSPFPRTLQSRFENHTLLPSRDGQNKRNHCSVQSSQVCCHTGTEHWHCLNDLFAASCSFKPGIISVTCSHKMKKKSLWNFWDRGEHITCTVTRFVNSIFWWVYLVNSLYRYGLMLTPRAPC